MSGRRFKRAVRRSMDRLMADRTVWRTWRCRTGKCSHEMERSDDAVPVCDWCAGTHMELLSERNGYYGRPREPKP